MLTLATALEKIERWYDNKKITENEKNVLITMVYEYHRGN